MARSHRGRNGDRAAAGRRGSSRTGREHQGSCGVQVRTGCDSYYSRVHGCDVYADDVSVWDWYSNTDSIDMWKYGIRQYWTSYYNTTEHAWRMCHQYPYLITDTSFAGSVVGWSDSSSFYYQEGHCYSLGGSSCGATHVTTNGQYRLYPGPCYCIKFATRHPKGEFWAHADSSWNSRIQVYA